MAEHLAPGDNHPLRVTNAINKNADGLDALEAVTHREVLTANRTYYVRTDGSDSNTGLADTSGGAFLTLQNAINVAAALDIGVYDVTITVGAGTFSTTTGNVLKSIVGSGSILIQGAGATTIITTTGAMTTLTGNFAAQAITGRWRLDAMKLTSTGTGTRIGVLCGAGSYAEIGNLEYGTGFSQHIRAADSGIVLFTSNYTISGGCDVHIVATVGGVIRCVSFTVTITGTPAWAANFITAILAGVANITGMTYSGAATGTRYSATLNGAINTGGGGASYFPGDAAGAVATGGQYA